VVFEGVCFVMEVGLMGRWGLVGCGLVWLCFSWVRCVVEVGAKCGRWVWMVGMSGAED